MPSSLVLLALSTSSFSLGVSTVGYAVTNALLSAHGPPLSPAQIQTWWKAHLNPWMGAVVFLGLGTAGLAGAELLRGGSGGRGPVGAQTMLGLDKRGWVVAGLGFTLAQFVFGGLVTHPIFERMIHGPTVSVRTELAKLARAHGWRTILTNAPAAGCFFVAALLG